MLKAILHFVSEPTPEVLENNPILLKRSAPKILKELEIKARNQGKGNVAGIYDQRRRLLESCRRVGAEKAFNKYGSVPTALKDLLKRAAELTNTYSQNENITKLREAAELFYHIFSHSQFASLPQRYRITAISDGGGILLELYQRLSDVVYLDQAIEMLRSGIELTSNEPSRGSHLLSNLGGAYRARFLLTNSTDDLRRALSYYNKALLLISSHNEHYIEIQANLGACLSTLYDSTGSIKDLEDAVSCFRRAAQQKKTGLPDSVLTGLGNALCKRYEWSGYIGDLEEAIESLENASVQNPNQKATSKAHLLGSLGNGLHDRFDRFGRREDLERAIGLLRDAVGLTPPSSSNRSFRLINLALALRDRLRLSDSENDFEESLRCLREAKQLMPTASVDWPVLLIDLQSLLMTRHQQTGETELLEEALEASEETINSVSQRSPRRQTALFSFSEILRVKYEINNKPADLEKARELFREASSVTGHELSHSLKAARQWAIWELNHKNWEKAVNAGNFGITTVERLLEVQLLRRHKETWLRAAQGLTTVVAYSYAKLDRCEQALEVVEYGQARLLSEALQRNQHDFDNLRATGHSAAYDHYLQLAERIIQLRSTVGRSGSMEELQNLQKELKDAIEDIRMIPGYEDFHSSLSANRIREATTDAPIVYLLVTGVGGLALTVTSLGCFSIWLNSITTESLRQELLRESNDPSIGYLRAYLEVLEHPNDSKVRSNWRRSIEKTTEWLYRAVMGPVLAALEGFSDVVVVPCGLLSLFPIHAAWHTDRSAPTGRRYALDRYCLRFAPNGRSILTAIRMDRPAETERLLAVGEPDPVSASPLPSARFEVASVCSYFPPDASCALHGKAADTAAVRQELSRASVFHFAGHARAIPLLPLQGGLILADDIKLTVGELLEADLSNLRLAVLSACETAYPGIEVPDEVVGLPTALAQAGVSGVIGSLWSVSDSSTALLMARFYQGWREDGLPPAEALRGAQLWLRDATRKELKTWLAQQHSRLGSSITLPRLPLEERAFLHPFFWAAFTYTGV